MDGNGGTCSHDAVVVTGATGFVGGALLKRLIEGNDRRKIICPVRAESDIAAQIRGRETLRALFGDDSTTGLTRIEWIRADLQEWFLGWDSRTWQRIASSIREIYHCAASVSFNQSLADAQRINVDGTIHIHQLAIAANQAHGAFRRFHHVSTAYVAGKSNQTVTADFLPADKARNFRNTYERTKARAERFLRRDAATNPDAVPISIYRPSIVAGDTRYGQTTSWNVLYVPMKMAARGQLPMFPVGGKALVDSVGIDVLIDAMLALSVVDQGPLQAFHITAGTTPFTVHDVIGNTHVRAATHSNFNGSHTNLISHWRWAFMALGLKAMSWMPGIAANVKRRAKITVAAMERCSAYIPYGTVNTVFDATNEYALLARHGIAMPDAATYLDTIIDYALDANFGRQAPESRYSNMLSQVAVSV